ncbi:hypothetical protein TRICI_006835 [Trichomonascus ciferrii]|uniref:rRNA adenine N(6)-methyltransferase n=1 Tax=Trichomonascus ciferrii TaxID=44093 RepID=A0A642UF79_9ASCO|nr:hypothetical protein TRICI_006835 [Trichomonascus ciferrii]
MLCANWNKGIGIWSTALHNQIKPKRHIMMEPHLQYLHHLERLQGPENGLKVVSSDPFRWRSFLELEQQNFFEPVSHPREDGINPHILFTANLSSMQGEQLCTQYLNCITNQSWLQRYGRVRCLLWVKPTTAMKLLFKVGDTYRSRVSVQTEACTDVKLLLRTEKDEVLESHNSSFTASSKNDYYPPKGEPPVLIQLDPFERQPENLDSFEYVIKMLFVLRNKPLREAINLLGAGAYDDLIPKLDPSMLDTTPRDLTLQQLKDVAAAFEAWPFKPDLLDDFYEEEIGNGV